MPRNERYSIFAAIAHTEGVLRFLVQRRPMFESGQLQFLEASVQVLAIQARSRMSCDLVAKSRRKHTDIRGKSWGLCRPKKGVRS